MARPVNRLTSPDATVHQTVHGYSDGHRLLASSFDGLKTKDLKTLLVFSDASDPVSCPSETGYLTGYPLEDSGMYALARTWSAPEMPRPGCVWTHTLLLDFADLAMLEQLESLLSLFKRPTAGNYSSFNSPISAHSLCINAEIGLSEDQIALARRLMAGLYGTPRAQLVETDLFNTEGESTLLRIWGQQWPRLRRNFRFCTQILDRSTNTSGFDLQFRSAREHAGRSRQLVENDESAYPTSYWLSRAVSDLKHDRSDLRNFLRELTADVRQGREAFAPLVSIFQLLVEGRSEPNIVRAIDIFKTFFESDDVKLLRQHLITRALPHLHGGNSVIAAFVKNNIGFADPAQLEEILPGAIDSVWDVFQGDLLTWLTERDSPHAMIASRVIAALPAQRIFELLPRSHDHAPLLISHRPDIFSKPELWANATSLRRRELVDLVPEDFEEWPAVIGAMIEGGVVDVCQRVHARACRMDFVGAVLSKVARNSAAWFSRVELEWLRAASTDVNAVARFLASELPKTQGILLALTQYLDPDAIPNSVGDDPWYLAFQSATRSEHSSSRLYLSCFLLARAFGTKSRSRAELIGLTFDPVHTAMARSQLPHDCWLLLEPRLPQSFLWFEWDRCLRLRAAVNEAFVNGELSPNSYSRITTNREVFVKLVEDMAQQGAGKHYLKAIREALLARSAPGDRTRAKEIAKMLR